MTIELLLQNAKYLDHYFGLAPLKRNPGKTTKIIIAEEDVPSTLLTRANMHLPPGDRIFEKKKNRNKKDKEKQAHHDDTVKDFNDPDVSAQSIVWQQQKNSWVWFDVQRAVLQKIQDIPVKNNPLLSHTFSDNSSSEGSSNGKDDDIPWHDNMNHGKAKEELEEYERFKHKKYQPKVREVTARCLTGESCQIMVGPVDQKGKILSSEQNLFDYIDV